MEALVLLVGASAAAVAELQPAADMLEFFGIRAETRVLTAGETTVLPGTLRAIVVASPDAALPSVLAAQFASVPVIRVPMEQDGHKGMALLEDDSGNLPAGSEDAVFAMMAIGQAGAKNAALFVVSFLALEDERLRAAWTDFRARQTDAVLRHPPLTLDSTP